MTMYQAITTKYLPCTNYRPSRVKATAAAGSVIVSWEHGLGIEGNHMVAAKALADKYKWNGVWYGGGLAKAGYVFVNSAIDDKPHFITVHK